MLSKFYKHLGKKEENLTHNLYMGSWGAFRCSLLRKASFAEKCNASAGVTSLFLCIIAALGGRKRTKQKMDYIGEYNAPS